MVCIAEISTFKEVLLRELSSLEERRRISMPGPTLDKVIESLEIALTRAGLQPWQLYLPILADAGANSGVRRTAVNLLHNPARVPEEAAPKIADTVMDVMRERGLDYRLGQQTVMAASILRGNNPEAPMLPISHEHIGMYFIPFIEQVPTSGPDQSESEAVLGHVAHMLASIARFTVVYGHAYDSLLRRRVNDFYKAQATFRDELEKEGKLNNEQRRGLYAIVHPMEHLAELMDQGTLTRDRSLVELIAENGVVSKFDSLLNQRTDLGIAGGDVPRYLWQRAGFLVVAKEVGI